MDKIPGPWGRAYPVVGNLLECLRPDFHKVLLQWADDYGTYDCCPLAAGSWEPEGSRHRRQRPGT